MKIIRRIGGSYFIILPKGKVEFFGWDNAVAVIDEFNENTITIHKLEGVTIHPKIKAKR